MNEMLILLIQICYNSKKLWWI